MANDRRLDDEIQFHIEQQTAKNIRAGMSAEDARRAALLKFGGVEQTREAARDEFRGAVVRDFLRDMRIGVRTLTRVPAFAVTAILTFGLGIGAAASMFSVFDGVLLKPLPYPQSDRIVRLYQLGETGGKGNVSGPNFEDLRDGTHSFAATATVASWGLNPVSGANEPQLARVAGVSKGFFDVMGVRPENGRGFLPDEQQVDAVKVAIVSWPFWNKWKGAARVSGEQIRIGGDVYAVVGVMPRGFDYPIGTSIWLAGETVRRSTARTAHNFQPIARLADGVSLEAARADVSVVSRGLKARYGDETWMFDATVVPILDVVTASSKPALQLLLGASILLLLVACTNVSNLLVARAASRRREFAVQLAIGATSGRIGRQLLAETLVLCLAGGVLGLAIAAFAVRLFVSAGPASVQRLDTVTVSWPALAFAFGVSTFAAVVLGLMTSLGTRHVRIAETLAESTRTGSATRRQMRVRESLIVTQVALTLVLLAGAGLLGRSLNAVLAIDPGFSLENALVATMTVAGDDSPAALARQVALQDRLVERLQALPGVSRVGLINDFPLGGGSYTNGSFIEMTRPDEITDFKQFNLTDPAIKPRVGSANYRVASAGYFAAMGIPLIKGRVIDVSDAPDAPQVAVISQSLAEQQWPGRDPLGRWIQYGNMDGDLRGMQIVGVVGDVRELTPEAPPGPTLYASYRQRPGKASQFSVIVRGPEPAAITDTVRRVIREIDPEVPATLRTVRGAFDAAVGDRRFSLWLIGAFSVAALALATLGVYGLIAYTVSQRTREMGIRMALGAEPGALVGLIVKRGATLAAIGAAAGLVIALALTGVVKTLLFNVSAVDPLVLAAVSGLTLLSAMAASYVPARRILKQTPGRTLRDI
jgi:putative ABC transport system permease protein